MEYGLVMVVIAVIVDEVVGVVFWQKFSKSFHFDIEGLTLVFLLC